MHLNLSFSKHRYSTKSVGFFAFEPDLFPYINISLLHNPLPSPLKTAVIYILLKQKDSQNKKMRRRYRCKFIQDLKEPKNEEKKAMFCILWNYVLKFKRPSRRSVITLISKIKRYCVLLVQSGKTPPIFALKSTAKKKQIHFLHDYLQC